MEVENIINNFKNTNKLTKDEIYYVVNGYTDGTINDEEMGSLLMLIKEKGLTYEETFYLTDAMVKTGDILDLKSITKQVVDKHSTGGVGDKVTLILAPIIASLNLAIAKMSGRSLGFTGGTIDKLESIPGYTTKITNEEFINNVNKVGISIISQTASLAPADKKIYALRDEIGAVASIPLIASSIMSKKIACASPKIVIDLKIGKGAFMNNIEESKKLAKYMIEIGKYYNREVVCVLTDMNTPLGFTVGNALEVKEVENFFLGIREPRLEKLIISLATEMASIGLNISEYEAEKKVLEVLNNNEAKNKFYEWITNQGGKLDEIKISEKTLTINSEKEGFITEIDSQLIAEIVSSLGAGRTKKEDDIDLSVGIELLSNIYDKVNIGTPLMKIYYNKIIEEDIKEKTLSAFKIESIIKNKKDIIISIIK